MKSSNIVSILLSAAIMTVSVASVSAATAEKYPGTTCHGDRSRDSANLRHGYTGAIRNANANGSTMDCPFVRKTGTGINSRYSSATVYVKDSSVAGDVSCQIMNRSVIGSLGSWKSISSTGTDTSSAGQILNFGAESGGYSGYSYMRCYFPATASGERVQITDYTMNY